MSEIQYASSVGKKFYKDGSVRQFPGNTVICFADPEEQPYQLAEWAQQEILKQPYGHKFAMLPPSSFHMTVFELLCHDIRTASHWSSHLALDAPLAETDEFFIDAFAKVPVPDNFQMHFSELNVGTGGLSFYLDPIDEAMNLKVRGYRDALSEVTGIRAPNHDSYAFHISLAYRIIKLTDEEEAQLKQFADKLSLQIAETFGIFDTGKPTLTFFDDMFAFLPVNQKHLLTSR